MSKKHKRRSSGGAGPDAPELNIMPFIDIFSMLNTFLLVSAAFIGLGILEVQVPFLSNSSEVKEPPSRSFNIRVDVADAEIKVTSEWTEQPFDKDVKTFKVDDADFARFHQEMIALRVKAPENDKVTIFSDDSVKYEILVKAIDAIKTMKENEPRPALPNADELRKTGKDMYLFEKVVIGSVIL
ncbi:MAG TPA: biopolymer transporter ExbD [Oligoflexus sp.]|uniref:ExbD/TolR family protein n=1 Tax=Oligoflexus sp. TaxID=1971216 RepID=UPI002D655686|nr:biopolymer transporter ExbD [Oligoflexus sp.]HYX38980.1 biopolymer transporter ExbD [Oligoflexus sp.]